MLSLNVNGTYHLEKILSKFVHKGPSKWRNISLDFIFSAVELSQCRAKPYLPFFHSLRYNAISCWWWNEHLSLSPPFWSRLKLLWYHMRFHTHMRNEVIQQLSKKHYNIPVLLILKVTSRNKTFSVAIHKSIKLHYACARTYISTLALEQSAELFWIKHNDVCMHCL